MSMKIEEELKSIEQVEKQAVEFDEATNEDNWTSIKTFSYFYFGYDVFEEDADQHLTMALYGLENNYSSIWDKYEVVKVNVYDEWGKLLATRDKLGFWVIEFETVDEKLDV